MPEYLRQPEEQALFIYLFIYLFFCVFQAWTHHVSTEPCIPALMLALMFLRWVAKQQNTSPFRARD